MKNIRIGRLCAAAALGVLAVGCKSTSDPAADTAAPAATTTATAGAASPAPTSTKSLVGTWDQTGGDASSTNSYTFKEDGTFTGATKSTTGDISMEMDQTGKYKIDGDKVTETIEAVNWTGNTDKAKAEAADQNKKMAAGLPTKVDGKLVWKDKDNIVLTLSDGAPMTLKKEAAAATGG